MQHVDEDGFRLVQPHTEGDLPPKPPFIIVTTHGYDRGDSPQIFEDLRITDVTCMKYQVSTSERI